jgi:endonuclease/exonuclease/phosphatase family metal-dependent hydrolase
MPAKRKRWIAILLAAITVTFAIAAGSIRRPAGDAEGMSIGVSYQGGAARPSRLRLASFNMHSGVGLDRKLDLNRTAELLDGFDLIWLNEVRGGMWGDGQTEELGRLLPMPGLFAPTERRFWRESFGNAVLCNRPITRWRRTQLPSGPGMAFRNVLHVEIPFGSGALHLLMAHIGRKSDNQPQLAAVADMFLRAPVPAVLMGDMNATADSPTLRQLLDSQGVEDPVGQRTRESHQPRIDHILLRGLAWTDAGLVENDASDHPMAWVDIEAR